MGESFTGTETMYRDRRTGRVIYAVPGVQYVRPEGRRREGKIEVDVTGWPADRLTAFEAKIEELHRLGGELSFEDVGAGTLVVFLGTLDFDYTSRLCSDDKLPEMTVKLIEELDPEDYVKELEAYERSERDPFEADEAY